MKKITKEFKDKSIVQLQSEEQSIRSEIAKISLEFKANQPKDTNTIAKKKKRLAVLLTILTDKKQQEDLSKKISQKK